MSVFIFGQAFIVNDRLNPYIAGAPVLETSMFFGREEVFQWIENSLTGKYVNHILVLHGQRRVGKTTVLKQIPNFLPKEYIQVFFDIQGRTNTTLDRFLWWMASEIVRTLNKGRGMDLHRPDRKSFSDPNTFITEFIPNIQDILDGNTLLLTFDEFDTLARTDIQESLAQPLIAFLRRLFDIEILNFIFSIGSSGNKLENMQASYTDFFKTALYRKVSFLTEKDCYDLITKPVENVIKYQPDAIDRIIEITSGHPYFTQLTCHELFSMCQQKDTWEIDVEDVNSILDDVIERGTVNLKFVWDEASDLEKWTLAALAKMEGASLKKISQELKSQSVRFAELNLNSAILHLRDKDVLTRDNRFVITLMKKWLLTNRPMDRVREELVQVNPIANRYIEIGDEYRDRKQYQEALDSYQQALNTQSNNIFALVNIANIYLEQQEYQQAASAFEKALAIDEEHIAARHGFSHAKLALGDLARKKDKPSDALEAYRSILNINPVHAEAREKIAKIYHEKAETQLTSGSDQEALKSLQEALEMTPEDENLQAQYQHILDAKKTALVDSWLDKAERARRRKRWDEAVEYAQEALNIDPEDENVAARVAEIKDAPRQEKLKTYRQEAQLAINQGNFSQAVNALQAAIELAPEDETLKDWLVQTEAARHEARMTELRQKAASARQDERWEEAIAAAEALLELEPEGKDAQSLLNELSESQRQAKLDDLLNSAEEAVKQENWEGALQSWEAYLEEVPEDQEKFTERLKNARKYAQISVDYKSAQSLIKKKQLNKAITLLQGIIAQDPTYKSTSRLLMEAVEANQQRKPVWRKAWFYIVIFTFLLFVTGFILRGQISAIAASFLQNAQSSTEEIQTPTQTVTSVQTSSQEKTQTPTQSVTSVQTPSQEKTQTPTQPAISEPTLSPEEIFEADVLTFINNQEPDSEANFSSDSDFWGTAHSENVGNIVFGNYIESSRLRLPSDLGDIFFDVPNTRGTNDYILSFKFSPQEAFRELFLFFMKSNDNEQSFLFNISKWGMYYVEKIHPDGSASNLSSGTVGDLPSEIKGFEAMYEVMIVTKDSTVAVFWEGDLIYYDDKSFMDGYQNQLVFWSSAEEGYTVYLDDIRYWSLEGVDLDR